LLCLGVKATDVLDLPGCGCVALRSRARGYIQCTFCLCRERFVRSQGRRPRTHLGRLAIQACGLVGICLGQRPYLLTHTHQVVVQAGALRPQRLQPRLQRSNLCLWMKRS
jgi:hypothetical protein